MALLATANAEIGTLGEFFASAGTIAASQLQSHMGSWAVRTNPAAATGTVSLRPPSGDMGRTAQTTYSIWFRFTTLPGGDTTIASVQSSAAAVVATIHVDGSGNITAVGATTSATVATVGTGLWFNCQLRVLSNAASGLCIDGLGAEQSFTAANVTQDRLVVGAVSAATMDMYVDDVDIYDAAGRAGTSQWVFGVIPLAGGKTATTVSFGRSRDWGRGT